jgi:hypothetical protein
MGNEFKKKYIMSNCNLDMNIKLKEYILLPGAKIEGTIELIPKIEIKIKNEQKILFKLTQFQKYEFHKKGFSGEIEELSDNNDNLIIDKGITKYFSNNNLNKKTKIDFSLNLPADEKKDFYPTFEFRKKDINIFIRHLLTIELPDLEIKNSTGIIISKLPEKQNMNIIDDSNIFVDESIKKNIFSKSNNGKFFCKIRIKKLSFSFDEEIPIILDIDSSELIDLHIKSIEFILQKKIYVKGMLDYKLFNKMEERIIMFSKKYQGAEVNKKHLTFYEKLKLDKSDLPEFNEEALERYIKFDENFIERDDQRKLLNPSINTDLFACEHKIKVNIHFNGYDINKYFVIDLYSIKPAFIDDFLKHYFIFEENPSFDKYNEKEKNNPNINQNDDNQEGKDKTENKIKNEEKDASKDFVIIDN